MPGFVWIALGVFVLCLVGGSVWAIVNGLRAWRRAKPALERMRTESAALSERSTTLEHRLAALQPKTSQLQRDVARFQRSVARVRVLFSGVHGATTAYRFARFFTP